MALSMAVAFVLFVAVLSSAVHAFRRSVGRPNSLARSTLEGLGRVALFLGSHRLIGG